MDSTTSREIPIVYIVDDDIAMREAVDGLIREGGWRSFAFASAQQFLSHPRSLSPSCLILDVALPDLNGLELQQVIGTDQSNMPIIFITGSGDVPTSVRAMKAGAVDFLTKPFSDEELLCAVRSALNHSTFSLHNVVENQALKERYASLSTRELEVMRLVVSGLMNKQVGGELGISEITVKAHRGRMMQKMRANSLAHLVKIAAKLELYE